MKPSAKRRGKSRRHVADGGVGGAVTIIVSSDGKKEVLARLADLSDWGVGVETEAPLAVDKLVTVSGRLQPRFKGKNVKKLARVVHTRCAGEQLYRSGLAFEGEPDKSAGAERDEVSPDLALLDHYETLQVSPNADIDTIQRVYRLLAQRYHPDNAETGNEEAFRAVLQAYRVLTDPEKRAAYDVDYRASRALRWGIFAQTGAVSAADAEHRTRRGILSILYAQRLEQPLRGGVSIRELEALLACPREHLEFSLWYLKAKGLVQPEDSARFSITADGVDVMQQSLPVTPDMQKALPAGPAEVAS